MTDRKRPIDQALDLAVYAPLGFVLEARKLLPSFVERGKAQVQMTRMIGKFAVKQGQHQAEKRLVDAQRSADALLGEFGLRPVEDPPAPTTPPAVEEPEPSAPTAPASPTSQSGADAQDLAIPDYDSLAASQVIPRLEALSAEELSAVARYEGAHRSRKTILGKINQLQDS